MLPVLSRPGLVNNHQRGAHTTNPAHTELADFIRVVRAGRSARLSRPPSLPPLGPATRRQPTGLIPRLFRPPASHPFFGGFRHAREVSLPFRLHADRTARGDR